MKSQPSQGARRGNSRGRRGCREETNDDEGKEKGVGVPRVVEGGGRDLSDSEGAGTGEEVEAVDADDEVLERAEPGGIDQARDQEGNEDEPSEGGPVVPEDVAPGPEAMGEHPEDDGADADGGEDERMEQREAGAPKILVFGVVERQDGHDEERDRGGEHEILGRTVVVLVPDELEDDERLVFLGVALSFRVGLCAIKQSIIV